MSVSDAPQRFAHSYQLKTFKFFSNDGIVGVGITRLTQCITPQLVRMVGLGSPHEEHPQRDLFRIHSFS